MFTRAAAVSVLPRLKLHVAPSTPSLLGVFPCVRHQRGTMLRYSPCDRKMTSKQPSLSGFCRWIRVSIQLARIERQVVGGQSVWHFPYSLSQAITQVSVRHSVGQVVDQFPAARHLASSSITRRRRAMRRGLVCAARRPKTVANASNTLGMSSCRALRRAVIATMMIANARTSTGNCSQNTVHAPPAHIAAANSIDTTTSRNDKSPRERAPEARTCGNKKASAQGLKLRTGHNSARCGGP